MLIHANADPPTVFSMNKVLYVVLSLSLLHFSTGIVGVILLLLRFSAGMVDIILK